MPKGKGGVKYAIVAVDYSTKWAEAEALNTITELKCRAFIWKNIICRYGVPYAIITDNGKQFDNVKMREMCEEHGIRHYFSSPAHPQANGQVEAVNKIIKRNLKTRLDRAKGAWPEKLPSVLWAYRTSYRTATGETPFSLAFGTEAVVPVEVGVTTHRLEAHDLEENDAQLRLNLDLLEERRDEAYLRNAAYQQRVARYYDARVKPKSFRVGDLVLRKILPNTKDSRQGTLGPSWEGPYVVTAIVRPGTYRLEDMDGRALPHPWNAEHLKKFYQ